MSIGNNGEPSPPSTQKRNTNNNSGAVFLPFCYWVKYFTKIDSESEVNNDHLIGNVQRIAIIPPNYEGKPKKGHLIFDASFECGMFYGTLSYKLHWISFIDR